MNIRVAAKSDIGRVRAQNEDSYLTALPLVAVADGMGGHKAGEVASGLAVETLRSWKDSGGSADRLRDAVIEANRTVWNKGQQDKTFEGMGTTLTAAWVDERVITLAHVGDSRAYLLRGGTLQQLTEDQTLVQQWENEGKIEAGEAARHPYRSVLLQALGVDAAVEPELLSVELEPGDKLLLSSDGMHGPVSDERIREILRSEADPDSACARLIEEANANGGEDNITVVLLVAEQEGAETVVRQDDTKPPHVIVSKPAAGHLASPSRSSWKRLAILAGAVVLGAVVITAVIAAMRSDSSEYVVATSGDHVAILRGQVGRSGKPATGDVVEVSERTVASVPPTFQGNLRTGIPAPSLTEARRTIANLPRVLGPSDTPTPSPTGSPTPQTPPPVPPQAP